MFVTGKWVENEEEDSSEEENGKSNIKLQIKFFLSLEEMDEEMEFDEEKVKKSKFEEDHISAASSSGDDLEEEDLLDNFEDNSQEKDEKS